MTALSGARWRVGFGHYRHRFVYNVDDPASAGNSWSGAQGPHRRTPGERDVLPGSPESEIPRATLIGDCLEPSVPGTAGDLVAGPTGRQRPAALAIIHAVAATPEKTWPADRFLEIAQHLTQSGLEPIFIGGPGDDLTPFAHYRTVAGAPLAETKSLLASATLFVGNDSGPAHMAAAFGLPVVVIFGPSDPDIWGPWRTAGEVVRDPAGIASIPVDRVIAALARVRVHA